MGELRRSVGVLVVEDEFLIAQDVELMLLELGFSRIYLAHDLATGREFLSSKAVGFSILDVNLGRELVFPLAAELCAKRIPIIFATARAREEFPTGWAAHPILQKPLNGAEMGRVIGGLGF